MMFYSILVPLLALAGPLQFDNGVCRGTLPENEFTQELGLTEQKLKEGVNCLELDFNGDRVQDLVLMNQLKDKDRDQQDVNYWKVGVLLLDKKGRPKQGFALPKRFNSSFERVPKRMPASLRADLRNQHCPKNFSGEALISNVSADSQETKILVWDAKLKQVRLHECEAEEVPLSPGVR